MSKSALNEKSRIYWQNRIELHDKKIEKDTLKLEKQLKKIFIDTGKEIKKELAYFYANNTNISNYENYRLEATLQAINIVLDTLFNKEEEKLNKRLVEAYIDTYKYFDNLLNINTSFETINIGLVEQVVKTNWSGLSFSERIWGNRRKLALTLKEELKKGLIRGESLQEMSRIMADKLNNEYSNALRLARTETAWIQCEATKQNYLDNDIKYYEFSAFLDKKTSEICKELDGKVIKVEEAMAGKNMPPLHPNCRSCMVPITEDLVFKETNNRNKYYAGYEGYDIDNVPKALNIEDFMHLEDAEGAYKKHMRDRRRKLKELENEAIEKAINAPRKYDSIEKASKKLKDIGIKEVHLNNVDPLLYDDIIKSFEYSLNKIPQLKKYMHYIGDNTGIYKLYDNKEYKEHSITILTELLGDKEKAIKEYTKYGLETLLEIPNEDYLDANYGMLMNNSAFKDYESALRQHYKNLSTGFLFEGDGTIQSVFTHEIGHTVDLFLKHEHNITIDQFLNDNRDILSNDLSEYGTTNEMEAFAELYSNYIHRDKDKQNTLTKNFGIWLEEKLKKVGY